MKSKQLYSFVPDIEYPCIITFDASSGEVLKSVENKEGHYSFLWPNGTPCLPIEMFLMYRSSEVSIKKSDGGTVGVYAAHLTHLARFCYEENVDFVNLTSFHVDQLISNLVREVDDYNYRKRNNDTIKKIISNCIRFLIWLQKTFLPKRRIIGIDTVSERYQIKLKVGKLKGKKGKYTEYNYFPLELPRSSISQKKPISESNIKLLWDALAMSKAEANVNKRLLGLFSKEDCEDHLEYMYKRRELQLDMLASTGIRPQELINIRVKVNRMYLSESNLMIPTLKRRDNYNRVIPLEQATVIRLGVFIEIYRNKLINRLIKYNIISSINDVDDVIYLNPETAKKVKPDAAYQEFKRLSDKAGITQKSCQSMFRHRFVTNMVKLHLVSFMDKSPLKNKYNFVDGDYRTILTKVMKFTGHKDPESLYHYIDLAWGELNVFSHSYEINHLQYKLKSIMYLTSALKGELELHKGATRKSILNIVNEKISEIEKQIIC